MKLTDLTQEDLSYIRKRARWYSRNTPWLVDELVGSVCVELARRPDLIENHPLSQAVNMLTPQRLIDMLKRPVTLLPSGLHAEDLHTPATDFLAEEQEWRELEAWLADLTDARAARSAVTLARFNTGSGTGPTGNQRTGRGRVSEHALVAEAMGISKSSVSRDIVKVRRALTERNSHVAG